MDNMNYDFTNPDDIIIEKRFSFFRSLPPGHYYRRNRWGWYMAVVREWLMSKGYSIHYYGQIGKPYTFWKRLLSFKWIFNFKMYWPLIIKKYD